MSEWLNAIKPHPQACYSHQGVIQDFEVEGGNEKSNQKMLLKKGQYPVMDTQSLLKGGGGELELGGGYYN